MNFAFKPKWLGNCSLYRWNISVRYTSENTLFYESHYSLLTSKFKKMIQYINFIKISYWKKLGIFSRVAFFKVFSGIYHVPNSLFFSCSVDFPGFKNFGVLILLKFGDEFCISFRSQKVLFLYSNIMVNVANWEYYCWERRLWNRTCCFLLEINFKTIWYYLIFAVLVWFGCIS